MLLDSQWRLPGTDWRFGLDGIAGLIPGAGDLAAGSVGAYLVFRARRLGVPRWLLLRMAANVAVDTAVGSIPVAGSLFDFAYKANRRNLRLLVAHLERQAEKEEARERRAARRSQS